MPQIGLNSQGSELYNYSIMQFDSYETLEEFEKIQREQYAKDPVMLKNCIDAFKNYINEAINTPAHDRYKWYGIEPFRFNPQDYDAAIRRSNFLYWDEYNRVKAEIEETVRQRLKKSSTALKMMPKWEYNDKQLGEFIYEKAAMSLIPKMYPYSFVHSRLVEIQTDVDKKTKGEKGKRFFMLDGTEFFYCLKVLKKDGTTKFIKGGEKALKEAVKNGDIVSMSSSNKKVYLYRTKQPKPFTAVKIIIGLTMGGWTTWHSVNDFYTGVAACVVADVLESIGYACHVEVVLGGGRCKACGLRLNWTDDADGTPQAMNLGSVANNNGVGKRFFSITAKHMDAPMDLDKLLYMCCDPTWHNVKWFRMVNTFFDMYGDEVNPFPIGNTAAPNVNNKYNPASTWHGIEDKDMINPIGAWHKKKDLDAGNSDFLHFTLHQVDKNNILQSILDIVEGCENQNAEALGLVKKGEFNI